MIQELAYLREIERSLCGPLGFISESTANAPSQVWRDLFSENRWETDFQRFLAGKLAEYRNTLATMQSFDLHALNRLRIQELLGHYQRMQGVCSNVSAPTHRVDEIRFIQAFQVLTLGYISTTAWEYIKPGRGMDANGFLAPFLAAGLTIDELAQSAERQGLTDAETYRQLLGASTPKQGQPQPRPKDAILNNKKAVSKLKILVNAGFCNSQYGWISEGHTNFQRAMAAYLIGLSCGIDGYYSAFEDLWGCKYLSSDKAKATQLQAQKAKEKVNQICKLLDN